MTLSVLNRPVILFNIRERVKAFFVKNVHLTNDIFVINSSLLYSRFYKGELDFAGGSQSFTEVMWVLLSHP